MVVVTRNRGGAYILAEMNGAVLQSPAAAYRVVPYHQRKAIVFTPKVRAKLDLGAEVLEKLRQSLNTGRVVEDYAFKNMPKTLTEDKDESERDSESGDESGED